MLSDLLKMIKTTLIRWSSTHTHSGINKYLLPTELLGEFKILYYIKMQYSNLLKHTHYTPKPFMAQHYLLNFHSTS